MYYGHLLEALKKYDEAVGQYEKAIQLDPTKTDLYKNISSAYEQKNDYKKAISAYQKYYTSLDKEHQTPDLQFQFGRLYYGAGTQTDSLTLNAEERKQALKQHRTATWVIFGGHVPIPHLTLKRLLDWRSLSMRR